MTVSITPEDKALRAVNASPNSQQDYVDNDVRRIFAVGDKIELTNKIFEESIALCLANTETSVIIRNCEFKKGVFIRRGNGNTDKNYKVYAYKTNFLTDFSLPSFDAENQIEVDTCSVSNLSITGKSEKIYLYASNVALLSIENEKCELLRVEKSNIEKYSLSKFEAYEVEFDTDDLAIGDYKRFVCRVNQTPEQVSEIYHRIVLKAAKSIRATSNINYQLTKATSRKIAFLFGYFYKPLYVVCWMIAVVFLYAIIYSVALGLEFNQSLYFSAYTFLTIGFGDAGNTVCLLKTALVFSEGLIGILYGAALLTSIINSSKK